MIHRCPDLMEPFAERAIQQLNERNHAVVLTGVTLLIVIVTREGLKNPNERVFRAVGVCSSLSLLPTAVGRRPVVLLLSTP